MKYCWCTALALCVSCSLVAAPGCTRQSAVVGPAPAVVAQAVPAREGPAEKSVSRFEIHEGTTVRVDDEEAGFRRIKLANGLTGWVPAASVELVVPPGWAGRPLLTGSARAVQP